MPSRAELRLYGERLLRVIASVAMGSLLWLSCLGHTEAEDLAITGRLSTPALAQWTRSPERPSRIHVELRDAPGPVERAWLAALRDAGTSVGWSGTVPAIAVSVRSIAAPAGGISILVAAPEGATVELRDDIGVIDSVTIREGGAMLDAGPMSRAISARVNGTTALSQPAPGIQLKRVLVLGSAGWESKFAIAALEEAGWQVDAVVRVAPEVSVLQGSTQRVDTARYSAVVAMDAAAAPYAGAIGRYVRSGGGLVLLSGAAALDGFSRLRAGAPARAPLLPRPGEADTGISLAQLPLVPLAGVSAEAVLLERRGNAVAVAARRVGAGRVLQSGYLDTWRWRMAGGEDGPSGHRRWWIRALAGVAYAPALLSSDPVTEREDAPLAHLVSAVGPAEPTPADGGGPPLSGAPATAWLFGVACAGLLAEWLSRRLRGSR